ncbi:hypothetical protein INT43_001685 [Umbelopsis isabellina]|uniref:Transglutaminase-like domain-containing protein n=1 Tax=Mortierella isabellina TaxID=91625 RepID=A0A8H7UGZ1_MORIS|nr:hypothetical protein INT43_001685 [Umbelopsis isabellina]
MSKPEINAIVENLSSKWLAFRNNAKRADRAVAANEEQFTRRLANQLAKASLIPVSDNNLERQIAREITNCHTCIQTNWQLMNVQDLALEYVPLAQLYEEAEDALDNYPDWGLEDVVIIKLLEWFKSFFSWVDQPYCEYCSGKTVAIGHGKPEFDDILHGALTVELYNCQQCHNTTRFPRYNNPAKLLETRRGRCGEWANCFTLCCRAVGSDARYVLDTTVDKFADHVWTEIFSQTQQRWVHCDPCENAFDKSLLYSAGWGKTLSYCIAFSSEEVVDVTRRYTTNWSVVLTHRKAIPESRLQKVLQTINQRRFEKLSPGRVEELEERHIMEEHELQVLCQRATATNGELLGRQSGSVDWRSSRKEFKKTPGVNHDLVSELANPKTLPAISKPAFSLQKSASLHSPDCGTTSEVGQEYIQLTPAETDQSGSAFLRNKISLEEHDGVSVDFAFKIASHTGGPANGADGLAFVIQSSAENAIGGGGCELGYGGIPKSLAVEFDTYDSSDRCADPSANHISIHGRLPPETNSAHHKYSHGHTSQLPPMNSGDWMYVRIQLFIKQNAIVVYFSDEGDTQSNTVTNMLPVLTVSNINIRSYLNDDSSAWIGFTASTGGLAQSHQVKLSGVHYLKQ